MEVARPTSSALETKPDVAESLIAVERDAGITRIAVTMIGEYTPVPKGTFEGQLLFRAVDAVSRGFAPLKKPPRAVFEIGVDAVRIEIHDRSSTDVARFQIHRPAIFEARANRFEKGFWLDIPGQFKGTFMEELPQAALEKLEAEIQAALTASAPAGA